jgi:hypothetical protein
MLSRIGCDLAFSSAAVTLVFCGSGCSEKQLGGPRLEVIPVTGIVHVDGKPAEGVVVDFLGIKRPGVDFSVPNPQGVTDKNGVLTLSTYVTGDGGVPGEYTLLFYFYGKSGRTDPITGEEIIGGDRFRGKYGNANTSKFTVTIPEEAGDEPHNIGTFELTTH